MQFSCAAPSPFDQHIDSEHISLFFDPAEPPCESAVAGLERIARAQSSLLGLPLPHIDYYFWPRRAEAEFDAIAPCSDALGCTVGSTIWARGLIAHELVHAIEHANRGSSAVFLDEGIAVALGEPIPSRGAGAGPPNLEVARDDFDQPAYAAAGDYVSFLLVRYGSDRVHQLMDRIRRGDSERDLADAFVDVLGLTPAEVWAARVASGDRFEGGSFNLPACAAADVVAWQDPDQWSLAAQLDDPACAEISPPGFMIPADGRYRVELRSGRGETARFRSCETGAGFGHQLGSASRQLVIAELSAGLHVLDLSPGSHDVTIAPVSATGCGRSAEAVLPEFEGLVIRASARRPLDSTLRFEADSVLAIEMDSGATAELCTPPFADQDCAAVASDDTIAVAAGDELCVRASPGSEIGLRLSSERGGPAK